MTDFYGTRQSRHPFLKSPSAMRGEAYRARQLELRKAQEKADIREWYAAQTGTVPTVKEIEESRELFRVGNNRHKIVRHFYRKKGTIAGEQERKSLCLLLGITWPQQEGWHLRILAHLDPNVPRAKYAEQTAEQKSLKALAKLERAAARKMKSQPGYVHPLKGKKRSPETLAKIAATKAKNKAAGKKRKFEEWERPKMAAEHKRAISDGLRASYENGTRKSTKGRKLTMTRVVRGMAA